MATKNYCRSGLVRESDVSGTEDIACADVLEDESAHKRAPFAARQRGVWTTGDLPQILPMNCFPETTLNLWKASGCLSSTGTLPCCHSRRGCLCSRYPPPDSPPLPHRASALRPDRPAGYCR